MKIKEPVFKKQALLFGVVVVVVIIIEVIEIKIEVPAVVIDVFGEF